MFWTAALGRQLVCKHSLEDGLLLPSDYLPAGAGRRLKHWGKPVRVDCCPLVGLRALAGPL